LPLATDHLLVALVLRVSIRQAPGVPVWRV
jgi:hypothetical protein